MNWREAERSGGSTAAPSLCYITPSYAPDIERFALLRRSLRLFSPDIPHLAYIDTEDYGVFKRRFGDDRNLRIMPTSDILPPGVEAERRARRSWRGRTIERVGWRLGLNTRYASGWKTQQIMKLYGLQCCEFDAAVFLDSDIVLCGKVSQNEYLEGNLLKILQTPALTYEDHAFEVARQILINGELRDQAQMFNYIHQAPRFLKRTAISLVKYLELSWKDWHKKFFEQQFPSEYNVLGYWVREKELYNGYSVNETDYMSWTYNIKNESEFDSQIKLCLNERGRRKFMLIQSNMKMLDADHISRVSEMIEKLALQMDTPVSA